MTLVKFVEYGILACTIIVSILLYNLDITTFGTGLKAYGIIPKWPHVKSVD